MKFTVSGVLGWKVAPIISAAKYYAECGEEVGETATKIGRDIDYSEDYWKSDSGNAARDQSLIFTADTKSTVSVIDAIYEIVRSTYIEIDENIEIVRNKKATAEGSEFDLFVSEDGKVQSRKSNADWAKEWTYQTPFKMPEKEGVEFFLTSAIRNALTRIHELDQNGGEKLRRCLEELSDNTKRGVVQVPNDPDLARILNEFNVDASENSAQLWPSGTLLEAMQRAYPGFAPKLMTDEEIAQVKKLMVPDGPLDMAAPGAGAASRLYTWYQVSDEATNKAMELYGKEAFDDGHGDAFRHTYWNALMTREFGEDWTKEYATKHEMLGGNPAHREAMDLYNNDIGRQIAVKNPDASPDELANLVEDAVRDGDVLVIGPSDQIEWSSDVAFGKQGDPRTVGIPLP